MIGKFLSVLIKDSQKFNTLCTGKIFLKMCLLKRKREGEGGNEAELSLKNETKKKP